MKINHIISLALFILLGSACAQTESAEEKTIQESDKSYLDDLVAQHTEIRTEIRDLVVHFDERLDTGSFVNAVFPVIDKLNRVQGDFPMEKIITSQDTLNYAMSMKMFQNYQWFLNDDFRALFQLHQQSDSKLSEEGQATADSIWNGMKEKDLQAVENFVTLGKLSEDQKSGLVPIFE